MLGEALNNLKEPLSNLLSILMENCSIVWYYNDYE